MTIEIKIDDTELVQALQGIALALSGAKAEPVTEIVDLPDITDAEAQVLDMHLPALSEDAAKEGLPSLDSIMLAGAELLKTDVSKREELVKLLAEYGLKAVPELAGKPNDVIKGFIEGLKGLGAKIGE